MYFFYNPLPAADSKKKGGPYHSRVWVPGFYFFFTSFFFFSFKNKNKKNTGTDIHSYILYSSYRQRELFPPLRHITRNNSHKRTNKNANGGF